MVNRVFCYSKEVAKRNGNRLPIWQLILSTLVFIIVLVLMPIIVEDDNIQEFAFIIIFILFTGSLLYYSILLGLRMRNRLVAYATDNNGKIYKVMSINNGEGLYFGGVAVGGMIDNLVDNGGNIGRDIGGAIGAGASFYAMNRQAKYMSNPELVAKIIEEFPNVTGAEIYEILRVYSISDRKSSIKVKCDYKIVRKNKVKFQKNLVIEKSYNMYEDLIRLINTHK